MGLLSRVASNEDALGFTQSGSASGSSQVLDAMGEALAERITRLPPSPSRAESALNLLKPYISFQAAFCAALEGDRYVPYAAAGIDISKAGLDKKDLVFSGTGFEKLPVPPFQAWAFNLGNSCVLVLCENPANPFTLSLAESLLGKIRSAFLPFRDKPRSAADPRGGQSAGPSAADTSGIQGFVSTYYRDKGPFRGLVLTSEKGTGPELKGALLTGRITELAPDLCLLLYPKPLNEKLIIHRLTESFGVKVLFSFEASGVTEALRQIEHYREA
jgi:hypothetical protein